MVKTLSEEEPSFTTVSKEELSERSAEVQQGKYLRILVHAPACKDVLTIIFIYSNFDHHQSNNYLLTQRCYQLTYRMRCITY
jgi:hypothetical protein